MPKSRRSQLPKLLRSCLPLHLKANYGSPCSEHSTSGEVCLHTRVASIGLYGLENTSLANDKEADKAGPSVLGERFVGQECLAESMIAGYTEASRGATLPALLRTHRGKIQPTSSNR